MNVENKEILHNPWFHTEIICLYLIVHLELFCLAILSRLRCRSFFRPDSRSAGFLRGLENFSETLKRSVIVQEESFYPSLQK